MLIQYGILTGKDKLKNLERVKMKATYLVMSVKHLSYKDEHLCLKTEVQEVT